MCPPAGLLSLSLLLPRRGAPAGLLSLLSHLLPHLLPHLPVPHLLPPLLAPLSYLLPHLLPHLLPPLSYMLPPLRSHSLQEHQKSGLSSPRTTQSRARTTEIVHETREGRHPFQPPSAEAVLLNLQDQSSRRELFRQPERPLPTLHLVPTSAPLGPVATPISPGVALLRREMDARPIKGQPALQETFEEVIKAAEKQRRRAAAHPGSSSAARHQQSPPHHVFGGPPGTGKSSSVEVLAKVLAAPEVALLTKPIVVTLNKDTDLSKDRRTQPQIIRSYFEKAEGGILFLDEVHQRNPKFGQALLTPLQDFQGKVMVIIAGYDEKVRAWLLEADTGLPSRFDCRVEFKNLSTDTLVEIGERRMVDPEKYPTPFSLHSSARDMFRRVMEHVSLRVEPCDLPLNARGARIAVDTMIRKHDQRDDLEDKDVCITTNDILLACPFANSPLPVAAASPHAPTAADEGRDGSPPAPAAAAAQAATGSACRSSRSSPQASERAAVAGPSTADAPAAASDSEDSPLSERARTPSKSAAPAPAASRKRKAESGDAKQRSCSPETTIVLAAIDAHYVTKEGGTAIAVMDFLRQLLPNLTGTVKSEVEDAQRASKGLRETLQKAIEIVKERGVNTTMYQDSNSKWLVSGFALLPPRAAVQ